MKFSIPNISWHNRDPVLSVDFQPKCKENEPLRLASAGTDSHVLIWYVKTLDTGAVNLEVAADLTRHQKAVNVVRWSPNGEFLASGDDEAIIFVWKQKTEKSAALNSELGEEQYKETWVVHKTLRGHMEDVLDLSWSVDSLHLASGSVDNKLLIWNVSKGNYSCMLSDHKGFVQGVAWDPKGQLIATMSSDRIFRTFDITQKKISSRSSKAILPFPSGHPFHETSVRLYHDDTLQTFYRRLHFSPDGMLIAVPGGKIEAEQGKTDIKAMNAVYIYSRYSLKVPVCVLPCGEPALACRWAGALAARRAAGPAPALRLAAGHTGDTGARALLAVATRRATLLYDTQQTAPLAILHNIHYTRLTDLAWSPDCQTLVASSTDGFCSIITFVKDELGQLLPQDVLHQNLPEPIQVETEEPQPGMSKGKPSSTSKNVKQRHKSQNSKLKQSKLTTPNRDKCLVAPNVLTPRHKPQEPKPTDPSTSKLSQSSNVLTPCSLSNEKCSKLIKTTEDTPADAPNVLTPRHKPLTPNLNVTDTKSTTPKNNKSLEAANVLTPRNKRRINASLEKDPKSKSPKIDMFLKFKTPTQKSPKKKKLEDDICTSVGPVKIEIMEEVAMPSWSDNSNSQLVADKRVPMDVDEAEVTVIEDSEDIKLFYEETQETKANENSQNLSSSNSPRKNSNLTPKKSKSPKKSSNSSQNQSNFSQKSSDSPRKKIYDQECFSPISSKRKESTVKSFLESARVRDVPEAAPAGTGTGTGTGHGAGTGHGTGAGASPRAPRRVSFVTLSSPKNKNKL